MTFSLAPVAAFVLRSPGRAMAGRESHGLAPSEATRIGGGGGTLTRVLDELAPGAAAWTLVRIVIARQNTPSAANSAISRFVMPNSSP